MKIKNTLVEETPFLYLDITKGKETIGRIKLYWSARSGMYGHQVAWEVHDWRQGKDGSHQSSLYEGKTSGCGYCKKSEAFGRATRQLGFDYKHNTYDSITRNPYHQGGNFYKISEAKLKQVIKATTC